MKRNNESLREETITGRFSAIGLITREFSAMKADEITRIGVYEFGGNEGLRKSNEGSSL